MVHPLTAQMQNVSFLENGKAVIHQAYMRKYVQCLHTHFSTSSTKFQFSSLSGGTSLIKPVYSAAVETDVPNSAVVAQNIKPLTLEAR